MNTCDILRLDQLRPLLVERLDRLVDLSNNNIYYIHIHTSKYILIPDRCNPPPIVYSR